MYLRHDRAVLYTGFYDPTVSILPSFHFICDWRTKVSLQKYHNIYLPFWKSRKPLLSGWVKGWGDQKRPSIFLIFKYNINKKNMLIPNIVSKIVYGFSKRSYKHFKFQNMTSQLKKRRYFNGICRFFGILKAN